MQLSNGEVAVAWNDHEDPTSTGGPLKLALLNSSGTVISTQVLPNISEYASPSMAPLPGGNFVLVWNQQTFNTPFTIQGQIFSSSGAKIGSQFVASAVGVSPTVGSQPHVIELTEGDFVVSWDNFVEVFAPNGTVISPSPRRDRTQYVIEGPRGTVSKLSGAPRPPSNPRILA
jgi:hypothetical protein